MPSATSVDRSGPTSTRYAVAAAALTIVALLLGRLWWLPAHASISVNEGWNATHAMRALGAGSLYPSPDALTGNNYPPLSFIIVGYLGKLVGDAVVAGRLLALVAQAATGVAICVVVRRLAPDRHWTILAAITFGGYSVTLLRPYLGMNDPQWLGNAAMAWALALVVPDQAGARASVRRTLAAAALVVAGGLVKHNLVAIPLAVTLWLLVVDRRGFTVWVAALALLCAAATATLFAIWQSVVFIDVLAPARSYSLARMAAKGGPLLLAMLPALIVSRSLWSARRRDPRLLLPLLLLLVAVPIGILQRAGSGVVVNAFFEAVIAASIAAPVALAGVRPPRTAWVALTLLPILCLTPVAAIENVRDIVGRDAAVARSAPFIAAIAKARGTVACDDQAICYWAGRESAIDFFSINQRLLQGGAASLTPALDRGEFALIQMRGENRGWRENLLLPAIHARYDVVYRDGGAELLAPRRGG